MRLPVISRFYELDRAPRRFLVFIVFNVVSWQCIVGPALVLLARKIGMPASWVGLLIAFMPISTLLVLGTGYLVTHIGPKRVMFGAWLLRNVITCGVFLMPWAIAHWGQRAGWYVLILATLGFCLMRAIGAGGWFPWLHEVVPENQRGIYFSSEASVTQVLSVAVLLGQAVVLAGDPALSHFLLIYGVGIAAGFLSLAYMFRVPGGRGVTESLHLHEGFAAYRTALQDKPFLRFVLVVALCFSSLNWLGSASVMYMRDALSLSSRTIMFLMAAGSAGILLTIHAWGRFAESSGSGRAMCLTLIGHSVAALAFIGLLPDAPWVLYALTPICIVASIFGMAFWTSAHRAMLNYVKAPHRVGYTNIWTVVTAMAVGLTPIAAGMAIDYGGLWGFRFCFLMAGLSGLVCSAACLWVVQDGKPIEGSLARLVNPALPVRTLARIAWISLGLHESNRQNRV